MNSDENKEIIRRFFAQVWNNASVDAFTLILANFPRERAPGIVPA